MKLAGPLRRRQRLAQRGQRVLEVIQGDRGLGVPRVDVVPVRDAEGRTRKVRVVVLTVEVVEPNDTYESIRAAVEKLSTSAAMQS